MTSIGLNLSAEYFVFESGGYPLSTFTLSPDKLEATIAQVTAQLIWTGKWSYKAVTFANTLFTVSHA